MVVEGHSHGELVCLRHQEMHRWCSGAVLENLQGSSVGYASLIASALQRRAEKKLLKRAGAGGHSQKVVKGSYGCGSKLNRRGYAGFGPCFHLPGFHFGTGFLSHSHIGPSCPLSLQKEGSLVSQKVGLPHFPQAVSPEKRPVRAVCWSIGNQWLAKCL